MLINAAAIGPVAGASPELRVGIAREAELPLAGTEHGVLSGLAIDLARRLTEQLDMELRLSLIPRRDLIAALKGGRIDLILTTLPEAELRALRLLPSAPLLHTGQLALVLQDNIERFPRLIDVLLTDGRVGFERGTAAARAVHQRLPKARRRPFATAREALQALHRSEIDVLVLDAPRAWNRLADSRETALIALLDPLCEETMVWAARESDRSLIVRINAAIAHWRQDATLTRLISRWIPMRIQPQGAGEKPAAIR
jgi:ABC-type amino acid transport substrate-binding protein